MSRRPAPAGTVVSLFPFLAVLLCTIGALILLLVMIARHSATQAKLEADRAKAAPAVDMTAVATEQEDLDWQVQQLNGSWEKTSEVLATQRAHLSHLEEHAQRLRDEIKQWEEAERQLAQRQSLDVAAQEKLKADIEALKLRAAEAEAKLAEVKGRVKRTAFAVVPYDGQNGTRRRPIYIECRNDSIILQPEGIVFTEEDFAGSLGPSNPLAACVRASAELYARSGNLEPGEQPYPLLLVRPNGIMAYYVARAAMTSWDSEFGYELVDADWALEFPQPDPQSKQLLANVQQEARARRDMIARAAPSLRSDERVSFSDSGTAGGVGDPNEGIPGQNGGGGNGTGGNGNGAGGGIDAPYVAPRGHIADSSPGNSPGGVNGGQGGGGGLSGGPGVGTGGYGSYADATGGPQLGAPNGVPGGMPSGMPGEGMNPQSAANSYTGGGQPGGGYYPGGGQPGQPGTDATGGPNAGGIGGRGSPVADAQANGDGSGTDGSGSSGGGSGGNGSGPGGSGQAPPPGSVAGDPGQSGSGSGSPGGGSGGSSSGGSAGGGGAGGGGGSISGPSGGGGGGSDSMSANSGGQPDPNISMVNRQESSDAGVESLSKKRGKDWSLPDAAKKKTPIARPVQIYCSVDRLTIVADRNLPDRQIMLGPNTADSVDQLAKMVWDQVETWGLAGRGMYWRPTLSIHYAPDGAVRFNELRTLLLGSGLEVVGKPIHIARPIESPYERR